MPTLKETNATIDAGQDKAIASIAAQQEAFAKGGKYAQLDWCYKSDPVDGATKQPDNLAKAVPGKTEKWADFAEAIDAAVPCNDCVHEYEGPQGNGWVLVRSFVHNGKRYMKTVGHGPEDRTTEWAEVVAPK